MFAQRTLIRIANFATNSIGIVFWEGFSIPTNSIAISTIIQMGIVFPSGRPRFRGVKGWSNFALSRILSHPRAN